MQKTLRVALVALALAVVGIAGTAGAAKFITGADIKNGSIGPRDLSRAARRALRGRAGPTGPTGPTGPAGAQGPAGPASIGTTVRTQDFAAPAFGTARGEVRCPDGMVAVGGSVSPGESTFVITDLPSTDGRGWTGSAGDFTGNPGNTMRIAVICTPGTATVLPTGS